MNPYGRSKIIIEEIITDYCHSNPKFKAISLRYFNAIGANTIAGLADKPLGKPENLIPKIIDSIKNNEPLKIYGKNYQTKDGTCIRDYIHVMDVAAAHTLSLEYLMEHKNQLNCEIFNIGNGEGVSVLELITAFNQATGQNLAYKIGPRRAGDVSAIYADAQKSQALLGWKTKYSVNDILSSAWKWLLFRQQEELDTSKS